MSCGRQELLALRGRLGLRPVLGGVRIAHRFSFLCCGIFRLRPVSFVRNVASFSGLSILECLFGFLLRLFTKRLIYELPNWWNTYPCCKSSCWILRCSFILYNRPQCHKTSSTSFALVLQSLPARTLYLLNMTLWWDVSTRKNPHK